MNNKNTITQHNYIVPHIYICVDSDGNFQNNMLMLAKIHKDKNNIFSHDDEYEKDLVFTVKEKFDDSLIHTFTRGANNAIITMEDLVNENYFLSIKMFPPGIWEMPRNKQISELKILKESLVSEIYGNSFVTSDLAKLSVILQRDFIAFDGNKVYYKKISKDFVLKSTINQMEI